MPGIDLFTWWTLSISFSSIFLAGVSIYVYMSSESRRGKDKLKRKQKMTDKNSIEFATYIILTMISIVGALIQTFLWLFPGCIFLLLSVIVTMEHPQLKVKVGSIAKNFIFVWVLLGLLVFYIFSIQLGRGTLSEGVFALGNIVVEALLVFYLLKNRDKTQLENRTKSELIECPLN